MDRSTSLHLNITAFHLSLLLVGVGAALDDLSRPGPAWRGDLLFFYWGWFLVAAGFVSSVAVVTLGKLTPPSLYVIALPVEIFGFWNFAWTFLFTAVHGPVPSDISLVTLEAPIGALYLPEGWFYFLSAIALIIPISLTYVLTRRTAYDPMTGRRVR
jgi:hypothetical protein